MNGVLHHILPEATAPLTSVAWATSLLRKIKQRISSQTAEQQFELESRRLFETSPHLLEDIGLVPAFDPSQGGRHAWKAAPERPEIRQHTGGDCLTIQEREKGSLFDRPSVM